MHAEAQRQRLQAAAGVPLPRDFTAAPHGAPRGQATATARATARPAPQPALAGHARVLVESPAAPAVLPRERQLAVQLLCLAALYWLLCVAWGACVHHSTFVHSQDVLKHRLPLLWFDRALRFAGPLLPFLPFLVRWGAHMGGCWAPPSMVGTVRPTAHFQEAATVYSAATAVRVFVYGLHRVGVFGALAYAGAVTAAPAHLMSDHVFLGASVAGILSCEVALSALDIRRARAPSSQHAALAASLALGCALYGLTCADMFYTVKYFHGAAESAWGVATGAATFQLPLAWWLLNGTRLPRAPKLAPRAA